jgi:hypothetical protein
MGWDHLKTSMSTGSIHIRTYIFPFLIFESSKTVNASENATIVIKIVGKINISYSEKNSVEKYPVPA